MKKEKIKDQLYEIQRELAYVRGMLKNVSNQMQELRETTGVASNENEMLRVSEPYEHPWNQHIRERSISSGNSNEPPEIREYYETITSRLGFSGGEATTQGPSH